jgi:hypothetical protein
VWMGRAKMGKWGLGATNSGRKVRANVWQRGGRHELKQARVGRGGTSVAVSIA